MWKKHFVSRRHLLSAYQRGDPRAAQVIDRIDEHLAGGSSAVTKDQFGQIIGRDGNHLGAADVPAGVNGAKGAAGGEGQHNPPIPGLPPNSEAAKIPAVVAARTGEAAKVWRDALGGGASGGLPMGPAAMNDFFRNCAPQALEKMVLDIVRETVSGNYNWSSLPEL